MMRWVVANHYLWPSVGYAGTLLNWSMSQSTSGIKAENKNMSLLIVVYHSSNQSCNIPLQLRRTETEQWEHIDVYIAPEKPQTSKREDRNRRRPHLSHFNALLHLMSNRNRFGVPVNVRTVPLQSQKVNVVMRNEQCHISVYARIETKWLAGDISRGQTLYELYSIGRLVCMFWIEKPTDTG